MPPPVIASGGGTRQVFTGKSCLKEIGGPNKHRHVQWSMSNLIKKRENTTTRIRRISGIIGPNGPCGRVSQRRASTKKSSPSVRSQLAKKL